MFSETGEIRRKVFYRFYSSGITLRISEFDDQRIKEGL
jgi:hypothetical protein